mgnify:CR=1 FL=1
MAIVRHNPGKILSEAVEHGDTVYLAGAVAEKLNADVKRQTEDILRQIDKLLAAAGSHKSHLLSATIWVTDIRNRDEMNKAWMAWIDRANPPARACVEAKLANPQMLVEIACIAAKGPAPKRKRG